MNNSIRLPNAPIFNREKFDCYYCEPEKFKEDFKSFTYLKDEEDIKKFFSDDQILDEDVFENNVSGTSLNKAASISSPKINCRHQSLLDWENISSGEGICQIQVYPDKKNSISLFEINETLSREVSKLKLVYDRNFENVERRNLQNICQQGGLISYGFQELDPCYEYWKFDYDWQNLICKRSPYFRKHHPAISFRYINADPYNLILPSKKSLTNSSFAETKTVSYKELTFGKLCKSLTAG